MTVSIDQIADCVTRSFDGVVDDFDWGERIIGRARDLGFALPSVARTSARRSARESLGPSWDCSGWRGCSTHCARSRPGA